MSWADNAWYDARWEAMPVELRRRCVDHLRAQLPKGVLEEVKGFIEEHGPHEWIHEAGHFTMDGQTVPVSLHHGWGTAIRNLLRHVAQDSELPGAPYPDTDDVRNWDDYYVQTVEAAALMRPVGDEGTTLREAGLL